jgi:hypothetical protein
MTEREMFEKSFQRPRNYFKLNIRERWRIDKELGILAWDETELSTEDRKRYYDHYEKY